MARYARSRRRRPRTRTARVVPVVLGTIGLVLALSACVNPGGGDDPSTTSTILPVASTTAPTSTTTSSSAPTTTTTPATTTTPPPTTTTSMVTTTTHPTTTTTTTAPGSPTLKNGDRGPEVRAVQQRLTDLGYWLGAVDGIFGNNTFHAVVALQKTAGLERTGLVDDATRDAIDVGVRPNPQSTSGRVIEIDRARQILLLVRDGRLEWVFDTSTGRQGFTTPAGQHRIYAQTDAPNVVGAYRPKYFYEVGELAIHGYESVPSYPYSHGCARVTIRAMDWLWANGDVPVGTPVWVY
jgi:peptidoglycan hydrolase-like protein with peptidoglycan-binding domain